MSFKWLALSVFLFVSLSGCKGINQFLVKAFTKPTGDTVQLLGEAYVIPSLLTTDDMESSCTGSKALSGLVMATSRFTTEPNELGILINLGIGGCEEHHAHESELAYLRHIYLQEPDFAQDALIVQKRHHLKAAKRYYEAWKHLIKYNEGIEIGDGCPELKQEFDQVIWMAGIISGLLALNNDILSGVGTGVPKNIAAQAERGIGCLSNDKWFGVPLAVKATVWSLLPGALPEGEDNWARLEQADAMGENSNIRLAHVFHTISAYSQGDMERVRKVIKRHAEHIAENESYGEYRLFDAAATQVISRLSDKMWTEAVGHRTPAGQLGSFWDENAADDIETVELDDLF